MVVVGLDLNDVLAQQVLHRVDVRLPALLFLVLCREQLDHETLCLFRDGVVIQHDLEGHFRLVCRHRDALHPGWGDVAGVAVGARGGPVGTKCLDAVVDGHVALEPLDAEHRDRDGPIRLVDLRKAVGLQVEDAVGRVALLDDEIRARLGRVGGQLDVGVHLLVHHGNGADLKRHNLLHLRVAVVLELDHDRAGELAVFERDLAGRGAVVVSRRGARVARRVLLECVACLARAGVLNDDRTHLAAAADNLQCRGPALCHEGAGAAVFDLDAKLAKRVVVGQHMQLRGLGAAVGRLEAPAVGDGNELDDEFFLGLGQVVVVDADAELDGVLAFEGQPAKRPRQVRAGRRAVELGKLRDAEGVAEEVGAAEQAIEVVAELAAAEIARGPADLHDLGVVQQGVEDLGWGANELAVEGKRDGKRFAVRRGRKGEPDVDKLLPGDGLRVVKLDHFPDGVDPAGVAKLELQSVGLGRGGAVGVGDDLELVGGCVFGGVVRLFAQQDPAGALCLLKHEEERVGFGQLALRRLHALWDLHEAAAAVVDDVALAMNVFAVAVVVANVKVGLDVAHHGSIARPELRGPQVTERGQRRRALGPRRPHDADRVRVAHVAADLEGHRARFILRELAALLDAGREVEHAARVVVLDDFKVPVLRLGLDRGGERVVLVGVDDGGEPEAALARCLGGAVPAEGCGR